MKQMPTAHGRGGGCRQRRNGRKPRGEDSQTYPWGEDNPSCAWQISGNAKVRLCQLAVTLMAPAPTARWIWRETCGSGWRTGMIQIIILHHLVETPQDQEAERHRVLRGGSWYGSEPKELACLRLAKQ